MSAPQEYERDGSGYNGAPDAKRPLLNDQDDGPDPNLITIKIKDYENTFTVNRQMVVEHSLYFERIMSGPWANASTGAVELEEGDHASPYNVDMFIRYVEYAEDPLVVEVDPLDEINDFGNQ